MLFITGLCSRTCWYCPLSSKRKDKDVIYANEHLISSPDEMLIVADKMTALGTGITGGEPFLVPDRLSLFARALKERFGSNHHIHLYSGIAPQEEELKRIIGLVDEIRLHPPHDIWLSILHSPYYEAIKKAKSFGFSIGIEVPSLPGIEAFIPILDELDFFNINELEWGDSNARFLREHGYELRGDVSNAVKGGKESVSNILAYPKVHWCSSDFKDRVQLRQRLQRIAANTARSFDEITPDGTIIYGVWECNGESVLIPDGIDHNLYLRYPDRIEMAWWVLEDRSEEFGGNKFAIERYPDNGMIVEVTPL